MNAKTRQGTLARGVGYGVAAGALWGLVFLAPALARDFTPLQLTIGRYFLYGVLSVLLIWPQRQGLKARVGPGAWRALSALALLGNTLYYLLLASAVQLGGIAMTSLVIGFLPVAVTVIGSREHGAVPLRRLAPSLLLCAAGAVCIGWQALVQPVAGQAALWGLLCAIGALLAWSGYAVGNQRCLLRLPLVSAQEWNLLTGVATGVQATLLLPLLWLLAPGGQSTSAWWRFTAVSLAVAVLASLVGNALWNRMSRLLPLTLVGQMILFETVFALFYGFVWGQRWPTGLEVLAFLFVVASVLSCVRAHHGHAAAEVISA